MVLAEDRQDPVVPHGTQRLLLELRHLLDEDRAIEIPAGRLQEVVERPVPVRQRRPDDVIGLARVVESFGDDDVPAIQFVDVAVFRLPLGDDTGHDLVAVETLAAGRVERDHLAGLELSRRDDGGGVEAEDARLRPDIQPAALVGTPPHRAQAHAIHDANQSAAIRADDPGGPVPRGQAP